jgi:ribosomal protein S14
VIVSSLAIGIFPIALRNVGNHTAVGQHRPRCWRCGRSRASSSDTLSRTVMRCPSAALLSTAGLAVFYGGIG